MVEERENNQTANPSSDCPVILHLSDLHFGLDDSRQGDVDAAEVLNALSASVVGLSPDWKPSPYISVISGDTRC